MSSEKVYPFMVKIVSVWILLGIYAMVAVGSQSDCVSPEVATIHDSLIADSTCGLYCDDENTATPLTDSATNKAISIAFLAVLIPAFICNLIFTLNNVFEHRENEETFQTTPITYDSLFVIDGAYLVLLICLIFPHVSHVSRFNADDGGHNTVSAAYICNAGEASVSVGNPTHGSNALCTILGLLTFSSFKVVLVYTAILCINIWYRLWKPLIPAGMRKGNIHIAAWTLVGLYDIAIMAFGGISADPATGTCYVSAAQHPALLVLVDTVPNICFVVVSVFCITSSVKQIRHELKVIQQANLVTDDLVFLIRRMVRFLLAAVISALWAVFTNVVWLAFDGAFENTAHEWIQCTQDKINSSDAAALQWSYHIGDECVADIRQQQQHVFPSMVFFLSAPIAALLSNMAILLLTCHRRHQDRWKRKALGCLDSSKAGFMLFKDDENEPTPKKPPKKANRKAIKIKNELEPTLTLTDQLSRKQPSFLALKPSSADQNGTGLLRVTKPSPTPVSATAPATMSIHVEHSPHTSSVYDADRLGTVRVHDDDDYEANGMTFNDAQATPAETPGFEDYNTVVVRHETPKSLSLPGDCSAADIVPATTPHSHSQSARIGNIKQHEIEKQRTLEGARNLSLDTQTAMLVSLDRTVSNSAKERLEHVANASFEYHNATANPPLSKVLGIQRTNSDLVTVDEEDLQRSERTTQRLREKMTDPDLLKRSSTGRHFDEELEKALSDLQPIQKTTTKSVKFADGDEHDGSDGGDGVDLVSQAAADAILRRRNTDGLLHRSQSNERTKDQRKVRLKKLKSSMDATQMNALDLEHLSDVEIDADIGARDRGASGAGGELEEATTATIGGHGRNLSHQQREQHYLRQAEHRRNKGFFDRFGGRKRDLHKSRQSTLLQNVLKPAAQFVTSTGHSLMRPSTAGYLTPLTVETQFNIDPSYYDADDDGDGGPMPSSEPTLTMHASQTVEMEALARTHTQMQWQNTASHFFTLTNDDFRNMLHTTFTPHSARLNRQMTFDPAQPYALRPIDSAEPMTPSGMSLTPTELPLPAASQSLNEFKQKHDRSVTAIGSDGRIVVSHPERFAFKYARSDPNVHTQQEQKDESETEYRPPKGGHRRNKTIHEQLLDKLPEQERKNLIVTFYADASANICEQGKHWKAETAKLNFTLRPVQSMKILL